MNEVERVRLCLRRGRADARPIHALAAMTGLPRRAVEQAIEELRHQGEPVCSATSWPMGVYLAATPAELAESVGALRRRALHQLLTVRALKRTLRRWETAAAPTLWDQVA